MKKIHPESLKRKPPRAACWRSAVIDYLAGMKRIPRYTAVPILLVLSLLAGSCGTPTAESGPPVVLTSIEPIASWIEEIGGPAVQVITLIPPSANPHLFELSPSQLRDADRAVAAIFVGAGLEPWSARLLENTRISASHAIRLSDRLQLLDTGESDHVHGSLNPHFWLDPVLAAESIDEIMSLLQSVIPDSAKAIAGRAGAFRDSLLSLDALIRTETSRWQSRAFIADHGTWTYFAHRYGLDQAALIERVPGRDASASELRNILALVRDRHVAAVFADERSNNRGAKQLSTETGLPLVLLRPTSAPEGYIAMMRHNLEAMAEAMR